MTRENKLALVVGFGLILFVGILISDHFSVVRSQVAADMTRGMIDQPLGRRASEPTLVDLNPNPAPQPAVNTSQMAMMIDPVRPEHRTMIDPSAGYVPTQPQPTDINPIENSVTNLNHGQIPEGFVAMQPEPPAIPVDARFHEVRSGDSFFAICKRYYGDTTLIDALAKFNEVDDPSELRAGHKLRIPPADQIGGKPGSAMIAQNSTPAPRSNVTLGQVRPLSSRSEAGEITTLPTNLPIKVVTETTNRPANMIKPPVNGKASTYTVKSGDSLASIANRFLGSKARWKRIYDLNRDVIDDPDNVRVGTVLKLI